MRPSLNIPRPAEMEQYLSLNGWHFNSKSVQYAVSHMYRTDDAGKREYITPISMEDLRKMLSKHNVTINEEDMFDALFVANMCKADFMGGKDPAIEDETHLVRYICRTIGDPDAGDGTTMMRWHATMCASGIGIDWHSLI